MKKLNYPLVCAALCAVQIVVSVVFNFPGVLTVCILPLLVLYLPSGIKTPACLFASFAIGFVVDFLSDGMLGLTSASLLPIALLRVPLLKMELKAAVPITLATVLFFIVYIWVDSAGMFPFSYIVWKITVSSAVSSLASVLLARLLFTEKR